MQSKKLEALALKRNSVVILRETGKDKVISDLMYLFSADTDDTANFITHYCDVVSSLYETGSADISKHILKAVLECDNFYIRKSAKGEAVPKEMTECLINELRFFQELSELTPADITEDLDYDGFLPEWTNSPVDIAGSYFERLDLAHRHGYGQYARYSMFTMNDGKITPVKFPDRQRLPELFGYERERREVLDNTLALIEGRPAQNVLLYGDAGTGKSSTVKAVLNELADRGLRLIEITKEQLKDIPAIIDEIAGNPLKFIIFIDDLSFDAGEDCFGTLKAALEGSVSARADNTVIYATSNRRHLVRERFSDREGDDIHRNDTMQETLSLAARFGLRVNFSRPDKKSYIAIASEIAALKGLEMPREELALRAEQFAAQGSGRSPRTARQLIDTLLAEKHDSD